MAPGKAEMLLGAALIPWGRGGGNLEQRAGLGLMRPFRPDGAPSPDAASNPFLMKWEEKGIESDVETSAVSGQGIRA